MPVTNLCVTCSWLDQESVKRWEKAKAAWQEDDNDIFCVKGPQFDTRRAHCTLERNRRQPVTDPVAGTHMDGPPWLRCQEVRRNHPVHCPDWKERQNAD